MRTLLLPCTALLALACNGYDRNEFNPPTAPGQQFLVLSVAGGATALPADGVSTVQLTAAIDPGAQQRVIEFTTTAGILVGGAGTPTDQTVTVDGSGHATLALQSATTPGPATVTAKVQALPSVAASLQLTFVPAGSNDLIRVVSAPASAPADGASASNLTVAISPLIAAGARTVTFTTNNGSFAPGSNTLSIQVPAGADLTATAVLYSPLQIGNALVTAAVAGASQQIPLRFERALPDLVTLQLSDITVTDSTSGKLTVTATLLRNVGAVTPGTAVTFQATRNDTGAPFGLFTGNPTVTAAGGVATATFSPGGSGYRGPAQMTARAENGKTATLDFQVTAP
jgi:hypothetical protein